MGDAMDGVVHGQRPIATPRPRIKKVTVKRTSKRKSAGESTESSSATSLNPTPSKKIKLVPVMQATKSQEQNWPTIARNHTALLESHANFLSALLQKSQPSSSRTPALVGFLSRTHEMLAQVKTLEAISPPAPSSPAKSAPNTGVPRARTPPNVRPKMENLEKDLSSVALESKKRSRSPSPAASPEKIEDREESPMKKIKSAPDTPVGVMKSNLKSKLGIRTAGAQFSQNQISRTPTDVTASTSAASSNFQSVKQEEEKKTEVKVEVAEDNEEVSLMEPDDFAAEVAARLRAKEKRKHKIVEGSKGKRRRRSSTVEVEERRREKRLKSESIGGGRIGGEEAERKPRRRISGVLRNGEGDDSSRGRA